MHKISQRTVMGDMDKKLDIIDHVNQDHMEELLMIAQSHLGHCGVYSAMIRDIYHEGILLGVTHETDGDIHDMFVPFELKGELEEQILYLAYKVYIENNQDLISYKRHYFEVLGIVQLTPNFIRLILSSTTPLPESYPGYAYSFFLNAMEKAPLDAPPNQNPWIKKRLNRFFLWLMKLLSSKNRRRLLKHMNKNTRIYTLRRAYAEPDIAVSMNRGLIDIFTHNHSPGTLWAQALKVGDIITSRNEADDKHEHLYNDQTVLIADETAYPAVAGILENWQNIHPPHVIILSTLKAEQAYFDDVVFPKDAHIYRIICALEAQGEQVLNILRTIESIDNAWGALETGVAKVVRYYLRNQRGLAGKNNRIKGYWRLKSED